MNPNGTNMPSASLASVHAAAARSSAPPPSTSQPQSETHVFPFSKQVVTSSDNVSDPSADTSHPKQEGVSRNSWADMSEDAHDTATGSQSSITRGLYLRLRFQSWIEHGAHQLDGNHESLRLLSLLQRPWNGCNMPSLL